MLPRTLVRHAYRRRSLASSVLFSRTYENESVAGLKKLAKNRGLSQKGNKSTLITRIREHEQHQTLQPSSPAREPPVPQVRRASSASPSTSGSETSSDVPGIPLARTSNLASTAFTSINLPDLSQPAPELPTPIPFYPDFYDSIYHPTPYKTGDHSTEPSIPKVLVVSGSSSAQDGDPSSDTDKHGDSLSTRSRFSTPGGSILQDVADDIGVLTSWDREQSTDGRPKLDSSVERTGSSITKEQDYSRKLNEEEVKGVWVLVALLAGGWLVGGVVNRAPKKPAYEHHTH